MLASMTTVSLSELLSARDESLAVRRTRPAWHSRALTWMRAFDWSAVRTGRFAHVVTVVVLALAGFLSRHALVLAGCAAFVIAAALLSAVAGWVVAGVALFFLEARRR